MGIASGFREPIIAATPTTAAATPTTAAATPTGTSATTGTATPPLTLAYMPQAARNLNLRQQLQSQVTGFTLPAQYAQTNLAAQTPTTKVASADSF